MKSIFPLTLAAVVSTLLITSSPLQAAGTDSRIESSAAKSYTFKTTLKEDSIKTEAKDGVVTLTGTVQDKDDKDLAADTVENLPGVVSVNNKIKVIKRMAYGYRDDAYFFLKIRAAFPGNRR